MFKKLDCFISKDPYDEANAKIIVFGKIDDDMLEEYDSKFGEIAKRKKAI